MTDDRLVVPEPGIGFPPVICAGLLGWKAFLKVGHTLYLSRYQHRLVKQEGWAFLLDDLNPFVVKVVVAGWRHLDLKTRGKYHAPFTPDIGMEQEGHATLTKAPKYAFKSAMMISMSMRKDHRTQIIRPHRKYIHIVQYGIPPPTRVIEHGCRVSITLDRQQQRIAMLGN
jgi:hypothetical protein